MRISVKAIRKKITTSIKIEEKKNNKRASSTMLSYFQRINSFLLHFSCHRDAPMIYYKILLQPCQKQNITLYRDYLLRLLQTGHLRTSTGNYFIKPAEQWNENDKNSIGSSLQHVFYRESTTKLNSNNVDVPDDILGMANCGVTPGKIFMFNL